MPEHILPEKPPEKTVEMPVQHPADLSAVLERIFEVVLRMQAINVFRCNLILLVHLYVTYFFKV